MTAPKLSPDVATATARLKDSQRRLTDERRKILTGGHISIEEAKFHFCKMAAASRDLLMDIGPRLRRELQNKFPAEFGDRRQWAKLQEAIEVVVADVLTRFANRKIAEIDAEMAKPKRGRPAKARGAPSFDDIDEPAMEVHS